VTKNEPTFFEKEARRRNMEMPLIIVKIGLIAVQIA
jgi:hypothetical protein